MVDLEYRVCFIRRNPGAVYGSAECVDFHNLEDAFHFRVELDEDEGCREIEILQRPKVEEWKAVAPIVVDMMTEF